MSIIDTITADAVKLWGYVAHAAAWLVGAAAVAGQDVQKLEADSPLVAAALKAGEAVAVAHGIPVVAFATAAADVLALAKSIASPAASAPVTAGVTLGSTPAI